MKIECVLTSPKPPRGHMPSFRIMPKHTQNCCLGFWSLNGSKNDTQSFCKKSDINMTMDYQILVVRDLRDENLLKYKHEQRIRNHKYSELSKSRGNAALPIPNFAVGHIQHVTITLLFRLIIKMGRLLLRNLARINFEIRSMAQNSRIFPLL